MASPPGIVRISLRAVLAWSVLAGAGFAFADAVTAALLPLMEWIVNIVQSDFRANLSVVDVDGNPTVQMSCTALRELILGDGRSLPVDSTFDGGGTDAIHVLVPIVIYLVAIASWPVRSRREAFGRFVGSVVLFPPLVWLTTLLLLVGRVEMHIRHGSSAGGNSQHEALMQPFIFMEEGGRWLIPLIAATLCIRAAAGLSRGSPSSGSRRTLPG